MTLGPTRLPKLPSPKLGNIWARRDGLVQSLLRQLFGPKMFHSLSQKRHSPHTTRSYQQHALSRARRVWHPISVALMLATTYRSQQSSITHLHPVLLVGTVDKSLF